MPVDRPAQPAEYVLSVAREALVGALAKDARAGHKTAARGLDGYKGHVAIDPDCEVIVATAVTAGNAVDGAAVEELLADDRPADVSAETSDTDETETIVAEGPLAVWVRRSLSGR